MGVSPRLQAVGLAPLRKPARGVQVGFARVVVVDLGGEEVHHSPRRFRHRREQPGGEQAGVGEGMRAVAVIS